MNPRGEVLLSIDVTCPDLGLDVARLRVDPGHFPDPKSLELGTPLELDGKSTVSAWVGGRPRRASLTLRADRARVRRADTDGDLRRDKACGLFVQFRTPVLAVSYEPAREVFGREGRWWTVTATRVWEGPKAKGLEVIRVDVPKAPEGISRGDRIEFDGLRAKTFLNADQQNARLDLEATGIRLLNHTMASNTRRPTKQDVPVTQPEPTPAA